MSTRPKKGRPFPSSPVKATITLGGGEAGVFKANGHGFPLLRTSLAQM
jgi:hypothetical protein